MKLNLKRPIIFFDIESTGLNPVKDRIVEISLIKVHPNGSEDVKTRRLNPECLIPEEASAVHGIYDDDVKDCPTFKQIAKSLANEFIGCDIAGYNSNRFDIPLLGEEFIRAGVSIELGNYKFIDVQTIFHKLEKRTLEAAYKFYCKKDLQDAHSAEADTRATYEVLMAQLDHYPDDLQNDIEFLAEFSQQNRNVDLAGRIILNEQNEPIINFGKHKGKSVVEVLTKEIGYYNWIMGSDFPEDTKKHFSRIYLEATKRG